SLGLLEPAFPLLDCSSVPLRLTVRNRQPTVINIATKPMRPTSLRSDSLGSSLMSPASNSLSGGRVPPSPVTGWLILSLKSARSPYRCGFCLISGLLLGTIYTFGVSGRPTPYSSSLRRGQLVKHSGSPTERGKVAWRFGSH